MYLVVTSSCILMTLHEIYPLLLPATLFNMILESMFSSTAQNTELGVFHKVWSMESHETGLHLCPISKHIFSLFPEVFLVLLPMILKTVPDNMNSLF